MRKDYIVKLDKPYTREELVLFIANEINPRQLRMEVDEEAAYGLEIEKPSQEELQAEEQELINHLTMTSLDLIKAINTAGVPMETIYQFLKGNIALDMELTYCNLVYCGRVRQLLPIKVGELELTDEIVVQLFKQKNGVE